MSKPLTPSFFERTLHISKDIWRSRIKPWWYDYQWPVILLLALISMILGFTGFSKYYESINENRSSLDIFYLTLQLFFFESGSVDGSISWELEIARWLAPAIATYTALNVLIILFREQLRLFRLRLQKNHIVICGMGRKGYQLAKAFLKDQMSVVVIEKDENNGMVKQLRELGVLVIFGNASEKEVLLRARVQMAKYVISFCGEDSINAEIAVIIRDLVKKRKGSPLLCVVQLSDTDLYQLVRKQEMETKSSYRLYYFNIYDSASRRLLNFNPIFNENMEKTGYQPHLLVVGSHKMAERLVFHAAQRWKNRHIVTGQKLNITVLDEGAEDKIQAWSARYDLQDVCHLTTVNISINSAEFETAEFLNTITSIYVCIDDDAKSLSAGLSLHRKLGKNNITITVCTNEEEAGLTTLLHEFNKSAKETHNLKIFGMITHTCNKNLLPQSTNELIAIKKHEKYLERNPKSDPWDKLTEEIKESNQLAVDYFLSNLYTRNYTIEPLISLKDTTPSFTEDDIEYMARMEHHRWKNEKRLNGWTFGEVRDSINKKHPHLVPWEQVDEGVKEENRTEIREIPELVEAAGFRIRRLKDNKT